MLSVNEKEYMWVEKYRPQTLDEIVLPESVRSQLRAYVNDSQVPHLILTSPKPGTGKTTTALAICNELKTEPLFLNGALDNTIDVVRTRVIQYVSTVSMFDNDVKIVVIDEAERLGNAVQEALKSLMEQFSTNARFIFTANVKSRILEPILSRSTQIDFVWTEADMKLVMAKNFQRVVQILDNEGISYDKPSLAAFVKNKVPDLRNCLVELQAYAKENGSIDAGILGKLSSFDSEKLISALKGKKFKEVLEWSAANADVLGDDFYRSIFNTLKDVLDGKSVANLVLVLGDYQRHHTTVPDRFLHFSAMLTTIMMECDFK